MKNTRTAYIPIFRGAEYGGRRVYEDEGDDVVLFESEEDVGEVYDGATGYVGVATVTWEEDK